MHTQEVGIHPLVPAETLRSTPLDNAVALLPLAEVASANGAGVDLPSCSTRMAVTIDGTESDEQIAALKVRRDLWCCDGQLMWMGSGLLLHHARKGQHVSQPASKHTNRASAKIGIGNCKAEPLQAGLVRNNEQDSRISVCDRNISGSLPARCRWRLLIQLMSGGSAQTLDPTMVLLNIAPNVSRLHASRRVFEVLRQHDIDLPVIHHRTCALKDDQSSEASSGMLLAPYTHN